MSDLSPLCAAKRTSTDHSEFMVRALANLHNVDDQLALSRSTTAHIIGRQGDNDETH